MRESTHNMYFPTRAKGSYIIPWPYTADVNIIWNLSSGVTVTDNCGCILSASAESSINTLLFRQTRASNHISAHMRSLGTFNNGLSLLLLWEILPLLAGKVENQLYIV